MRPAVRVSPERRAVPAAHGLSGHAVFLVAARLQVPSHGHASGYAFHVRGARVADSRPWLVFGPASAVLLTVAAVVAGVVLVIASHPTGAAGAWWFALPILGLLSVCCWLAVAIPSIVHRRLPVGVIIAPLVGVLTIGLLHTSAASRLRFTLVDRARFEAVVAQAPAAVIALPDHDLTDDESYQTMGTFPGHCPSQIGSLHIRECATFAAGYLFYDSVGSGFVDDGGVAYLPAGVPTHDVGNGSFESPQFEHLAGPWYAFASSW